MATTTPNFGWSVPTSTDLVKDGATAIETLGDSIDASLVDLKGGTTGQVLSKTSNTDMDFTWVAQDDSNAIQNAIVTAKGDLIAATASATPARLAVGSNGTVLTADSTAASGVAWAAVPAGGMTAIASGSLSGASVTLSSISGTYKNLQLVLRDFSFSSGSGNNVKVTVNSITSYSIQQVATGSNGAALQTSYDQAVAQIYLFFNSLVQTPTASSSVINIYDYAGTTAYKMIGLQSQGDRGGGLQGVMNYTAVVNATAAITSITIGTNGANYSGGTYTLYGVS